MTASKSTWHDIPLMPHSGEEIFNMVVEIPRGANEKMEIWEDPAVIDSETHAKGDDDPLDACEIGSQVGYTGQVKRVKMLGAFIVLDQGETDWKVVVIDVEDPLAARLNNLLDVEAEMPGLLTS
ncbi:Inorganic pyrophosphatase [Penicillium occitanis (nom. inval.)]|nr:Inorganic pyrophosphatase [Penicillium occitanis (nom. inval.)]PCG88451.1 hypothetical protein PENOC_110940 [Penicillium occitanis (nom. inval.)]